MNLLLLAVWCGFLLSCTVSLPKRRHIKYPATKPQNLYYERSHPTALEILERTLLRPKDKKQGLSQRNSGEKRPIRHHKIETTSPMYASEDDMKIESCIASFGDQSPLCKPRKRLKKSFVGIPDFHKRLFRSDSGGNKNTTLMTSSTVDDFFSVFKRTAQEPQTGPINKEEYISKSNIPPVVTMSYYTREPTSTPITTKHQTEEAVSQKETSLQTSVQPTTGNDNVKASVVKSEDTAANDEVSKIILPGSVRKIESEPQLIYLEQADGSENDRKNEFYIKELEETGDNIGTPEDVTVTEAESTTQLTLPPLKNSFLSGATYSKASCESENKKKCICSLPSVDSDFQTIFSKASLEEEIMAELSNMKCRRYAPRPEIFDLNTNSKPRVLKFKHTPFAIDNRQGAKEVTEKSLDEFIAYSALDDGITRVFVSSDIKIPCFPRPDIHLSATDADNVKYTWTYGSRKQAITKGRITEDTDGDGSLTIQDIELTDSMNYSCEIDYIHPDTGERTTDTFLHSLSVVTLPTVSARAMIHYKSSAACDESLLEMFEMYLPQQVEKAICSPERNRPQLCKVVIHSPVCHSEGQGKSKREASEDSSYWYREKRQTSMEMSLNYDVYIHRPGAKTLPGAKSKLCNPDCHLLLNFKLLQFFRESVHEIALIPIISKVQDGGTFTPVPGSLKVKYIFGCIGGYYLDNGFCLACPKGMYSDDGATECQECPLHTYSGGVGTRRCTPCKHMWMPICNEAFESINIRMILYVVGGVVVLVLVFVAYYVFWYKGQTWREVMKKGPSEKFAKSERIRSRKEAKRQREEREAQKKMLKKDAKKNVKIAEEEMEKLVQTSESGGETETESNYQLKPEEVR